MESSKIKNLVIIVLILLNVFFLIIAMTDFAREKAEKSRVLDRLEMIMAQNGIALDPGVIADDVELASYAVKRDLNSEAAVAELFLGETSMEPQGGKIYKYESDRGTAVFRSGGEFEIELPGGYESGKTAESTVRDLLEAMDVEYIDLDILEGNDETGVTAVSSCNKTIVYNCRITFVFDGETLVLVHGRRFADLEVKSNGGETMTAATALLQFLAFAQEKEYDCTEIIGAETGYLLTISVLGEGTIMPVWKIISDVGNYYVNTTTGGVIISAD